MTPGNRLAADLDRALAATAVPWDALRGARVFVTGATGFFGCWLLETLLWANDRLALDASLIALTRDARRFGERLPHLARHAAVTLHEGDVRTFAYPAGPVTHVIHAAVESTPPARAADREQVFDVIVQGTRRALDYARSARAGRFLLASTGAVYGPQPRNLERLPEDFPGGPDPADRATTGAEAKRAAEALCAIYADGPLQPTIARCFAFIGPYLPLDAKFAASHFIRDALRGGPIVVSGDGTPVRSYMYAADLAVWLWAILLRGDTMRPYNVGSEAALTVAELARLIGETFAPPVEVSVRGASLDHGGGGSRYVPSTARARAELGVATTVSIGDAIARTVEWYAAG